MLSSTNLSIFNELGLRYPKITTINQRRKKVAANPVHMSAFT